MLLTEYQRVEVWHRGGIGGNKIKNRAFPCRYGANNILFWSHKILCSATRTTADKAFHIGEDTPESPQVASRNG